MMGTFSLVEWILGACGAVQFTGDSDPFVTILRIIRGFISSVGGFHEERSEGDKRERILQEQGEG